MNFVHIEAIAHTPDTDMEDIATNTTDTYNLTEISGTWYIDIASLCKLYALQGGTKFQLVNKHPNIIRNK